MHSHGWHEHSLWWVVPLIMFTLFFLMMWWRRRSGAAGYGPWCWSRRRARYGGRAKAILEERYARGEIDLAQLSEMRQALDEETTAKK